MNYFLGFGLAVFFFFAAGFFVAFFLGAGFFFAFSFVFVFAFFLGLGLALGAAGRVGFSPAGSGLGSAGDSIICSEASSCSAPAVSGGSALLPKTSASLPIVVPFCRRPALPPV